MPVFIAGLWTAALALIPTFVGKVLIALGVAYVSYRGINEVFTVARETLFLNIAGGGAVVLQLAGILQIGTAINIISSSYLAKLAVDGVIAGVFTKTVFKKD